MAGMDVVVVAAGRSERMRGIDKIFVPVRGIPLVAICLQAFQASDDVHSVTLVVAEGNRLPAQAMVAEWALTKVAVTPTGGPRRQDSVRAGLEAGGNAAWVAVHDGARPFVTHEMLARGKRAAAETGASIAAIPARDTIKDVGADRIIRNTPNRDRLWVAQTPQIFDRTLLLRAHREVTADVTDDAAMIEAIGGRVAVFEGTSWNIKVTTPEDLLLAEAIAGHLGIGSAFGSHGESATGQPVVADGGTIRYGVGFDGHRLIAGGPLRLGGIDVPAEVRLEGHSDGDVLLHAVASAVLGAAGLGDLGRHFPSSDPALRGVDSRTILARAVTLARASGWVVEYVDATIVAQRPKLAPYLEQIGKSVAGTLGLADAQVNVKATSTDHVGAIGRGEGIAAQAMATARQRAP
ncbi:MAG: 2-C-methyl-D-erythritol 4-phosphate cytidylyltransferase [SAR202 cluster bacterium]|nr:2-C-methyl-D-erythritol 4-phosphate cytidylyltransferase [SAR202 cluster bacterium]